VGDDDGLEWWRLNPEGGDITAISNLSIVK